jgi:hypothetical protein
MLYNYKSSLIKQLRTLGLKESLDGVDGNSEAKLCCAVSIATHFEVLTWERTASRNTPLTRPPTTSARLYPYVSLLVLGLFAI